MPDNSSSNITIAKNTLLLYGRMFITILLGLYTSRVVLNSLGFTDYGIYNLVGGIVSMLSFLNVGMTQSSHRFIAYELGRGNNDSLKNVFSNSFLTHAAIAFSVLLIFETGGLWFVNQKLVIPDERMMAANCVFQCSILTACLSILSVPFSACVVAHEKMGQFAYISIIETFLKLLVALGISHSPIDKLCYYAIALFLIQVLVLSIYVFYCRNKFEESRTHIRYDKEKFKEMISFACWGCVGNMGFSLKDQLSNILLNLFFGTTVNAARGVATQVNGIISGFAVNFTMAMNPQITKQYSSGNIDRCVKLTMVGSRYAFYLLSIVVIPFIVNEHYILRLWLGDVPEYTDTMVCIILVASCVYSMSHTISTTIAATGHMKWFQIFLTIILLSEIPIAYIILIVGGNPCMAVAPCVITNFLSLLLRMHLVHDYIPEFDKREYLYNTILKGIFIFCTSLGLSYIIARQFTECFISFLCVTVISVAIVSSLIYVLGLSKSERTMINLKVSEYLNRK